jgi:hypothetical protein
MIGILLRLGRTAGKNSETGNLRYLALALATFALGLAFLAFAAADITYSARAHREMDRAPITHLPESHERPVALWGAGFDTVNERQYSPDHCASPAPARPSVRLTYPAILPSVRRCARRGPAC